MNPFPNVVEGFTFFPASDATPNYNCIAWAVCLERQPIWPDEHCQLGWPPGLEREESLKVFRAFFEMVGFIDCVGGALEAGVEKIAIYAKNGFVTHAARQVADGRWTSKMGQGVDAFHPSPQDLCGEGYGQVAAYMRRPRTNPPHPLPELRPPPPKIIRV